MTDLRKYITRRVDIDTEYLGLLKAVYQTCPEALSFLDSATAEQEEFIKYDLNRVFGARLFCNSDLYDLWENEILESQKHDFLCCLDPLIYGIFTVLFGNDWDYELYSGTSSEILGVAFNPDGFDEEWKNTAMKALRTWFIQEFSADPEDPYPSIIDNFGPPDECESAGSYALFRFGASCDPVLVDDCMQMIGVAESDDACVYGQMVLGDYELNYEMELDDVPQSVIDAVKAHPKKKEISAAALRAMECFSYNGNVYTKMSMLIDRLLNTYHSETQVLL